MPEYRLRILEEAERLYAARRDGSCSIRSLDVPMQLCHKVSLRRVRANHD